MSKPFLWLAIFIIALCLIQNIYIQAYGFNSEDFYAPSIKYVLQTLSDMGLDLSFNKGVSQLREFLSLITDVWSDFSDFVDGFNAPDTNLFSDIFYILKICGSFIFSWFETVVIGAFKLFGFIVGFISDLIEYVLYLFGFVKKLLLPTPKPIF